LLGSKWKKESAWVETALERYERPLLQYAMGMRKLRGKLERDEKEEKIIYLKNRVASRERRAGRTTASRRMRRFFCVFVASEQKLLEDRFYRGLVRNLSIWWRICCISCLTAFLDRRERAKERRCLFTVSRASSASRRMSFMLSLTLA
jgi:hypothetical protein